MGIVKNDNCSQMQFLYFEIRLSQICLAFIIVIEIKGGRYVFYHGNYGEQKVDGAFLPLPTFKLALH